MAITYEVATQKEIQDRVRYKYRDSIARLNALNFEELCSFSETMPALGISNGLIGILGVIAALPNEVSRIGRDLSASLFFILMVSREYDTYVAPFGLGVKFYTSFTDGTCLITANFGSPVINDDAEKLYKFAQPGSIEAAWKHHQTRVDTLTASGKQRKYHLSFDDFRRLANKEDSYMLKPKPLATAIFGDMGSTIIAAIIFGCMLVAATFLFLFLPGVMHFLYPACWFVRNLDKPPLLQSLLIALGCIALSWFLARIQKNTYIVDGIGTMFRGQTPLPDSRGYISTKWLVFVFLPILPIRSYQIDGESSNSMHALKELHWTQIKETIWQFKLWYVLVALLWVGFGVWTFWECM